MPAGGNPSETKESTGDSKAPGEGSASETTETQERIVPEKYDLKLSEDSILEASALDRIAAVAKAQGLTQEEATAFLKNQEEDVQNYINEMKDVWKKQAISDKEIGGEKLNENVALASRVIDRYASPELKTVFNKTGYGNHPELVRMFVRIGREMGNDKAIVPGAQGSSGPKSDEEIFYGKQESA